MVATSSSTSFFGSVREDNQNHHEILQQYSSITTSSSTAPQKKRRTQPGTPNPDAEVVALSPRALITTNRFICEVCKKGFKREQNLQLHRRGHNLPWKLKQKTTKEVRKKVYLCPEPTCVHHDPSRALGDLTGIKKHYFRKHGEKKWKCDKCSKRYAVQSDWKAHSKTCGTREYRCDCGTLFSRRDSFITHRAFCDALTKESASNRTSSSTLGSHLYGNTNRMSLGLSQMRSPHTSSFLDSKINPPNSRLKQQIPLSTNDSPLQASALLFMQDTSPLGFQDNQPHNLTSLESKPLHQQGLTQLHDLQSNTNNPFKLSFFTNNSNSSSGINDNSGFLSPNQFIGRNISSQGITLFSNNAESGVSSLFGPSVQHDNNISNPHMSATALLQKAAQIGSTTSPKSSTTFVRGLANSSPSTNFRGHCMVENDNNLQELMNSLVNGSSSNIFGGGHGQDGIPVAGFDGNFGNFDDAKLHQNLTVSNFGSDRLTLDFLGVGEMVRNVGGGGSGFSQREQQYDISISNSSLETEMKSSQASNPFGRS